MANNLTSPANGSTTQYRQPTFTGNYSGPFTNPGGGGSSSSGRARVHIASDAAFLTTVYDYIGPTNSLQNFGTFSFQIPSLLPNGTYYVRVRGESGSGSLWSDFSATYSFTVNDPVEVPTNPAPTGTITTSFPTLSGKLLYQLGGYSNNIQFQICSDAGYTVNVLGPVNAFQVAYGGLDGGRPWYTRSYPLIAVLTRIPQGTYYFRMRGYDDAGSVSAWQNSSFVISHPPGSSNHSPSLGGAVAVPAAVGGNITIPFVWTFTDPEPQDAQTAYTIQVWQNSAPGVVLSSGDVVSTVQGGSVTVPAAWEGTDLRWKVRTRDTDNVWGAYSSDKAAFAYFRPTATITLPTADEELITPQPVFAATFGATAGRTLVQQKFTVYKGTIGSIGVQVDSSGWQSLTTGLWQPSSPILEVGQDYVLEVTFKDSVGIDSVPTLVHFTADYPSVEPAVFTVDDTIFSTRGGVIIDWAGTTTLDPDFVAWRAYRRDPGADWVLLAELPVGTTSWIDYLAPTDASVEYSVVQVALKFSANVESVRTPATFLGSAPFYALVLPENNDLNLILYHVTGDQFQDEQEMAAINLIARGRRVEYGTRFGRVGSLDCAFYDNDEMTARQQRLWLETIRDSGEDVYLRNPFGDVWRVALMSAPVTRIPGVGQREYATVTIEYSEITA